MSPETLPNIAHLNAKLAADNNRVNAWIDGLVERIDKLVDACSRSDWMEVKRLSQFISRSSAIYGFPLLAENADRLALAVDGQNETEMKRAAIKVIGAAGRARKPVG